MVGSSRTYTGSDFFAQYDAGGEIFGLAIATVFVSRIDHLSEGADRSSPYLTHRSAED